MQRIVTAGVTALFVTASSLVFAQAPSAMSPSRSDLPDGAKLADARIEVVKLALQLTPEQMKYWPAIESAIQSRAQDRLARLKTTAETVGERRGEGVINTLQNRDPVGFMNRRADALAQRSAELKKLAAAWQPLYQTLSPDQKRRMAVVTAIVVRDVRDVSSDDE